MLPLANPNAGQLIAAARKAQKAGNLQHAEMLYRRTLAVAPTHADVLFQLGQILSLRNRPVEALEFLEKADKHAPDTPVILSARARVMALLGRFDEAAKLMERVVARNPDDDHAWSEKGLLHQQAGAFDAAEAAMRKAISLNPTCGAHYRSLVGGKRINADDPLIAEMEALYLGKTLPPVDQADLGFALAKAHEDSGAYEKVFPYLDAANLHFAKTYPFNLEKRAEDMALLQRLADGLGDVPRSEGGKTTPIFIIGLPRSGTTLVERIIGAHSAVSTASEAGIAARVIFDLLGQSGEMRPAGNVTEEGWRGAGAIYEKRLLNRANLSTAFVTDKSIQTFMVMGYLAKALPQARFVLVRRDPRDTAVSIYKNAFAPGTHRYATDLKTLAGYMRLYEDMVAFWRPLMQGRMHDLHYEELVRSPEAVIRPLLTAVGLPWEDRVLEFHKDSGAVNTLSLHQVRQPLNTGSVGIWKRYADGMQPFLKAWDSSA